MNEHRPELYENAGTAIRYVLDHLAAEHGLTGAHGCCLWSATADLRISELVDETNFIVSACPPLLISA